MGAAAEQSGSSGPITLSRVQLPKRLNKSATDQVISAQDKASDAVWIVSDNLVCMKRPHSAAASR